jgi:hypothetical protein
MIKKNKKKWHDLLRQKAGKINFLILEKTENTKFKNQKKTQKNTKKHKKTQKNKPKNLFFDFKNPKSPDC